MPTIIRFEAEHLLAVNNPLRDVYGVRMILDQGRAYEVGLAYTVCLGERKLGCAGILVRWQGTGVVWTWLSEELFNRYKFWLHREIRTLLPQAVEFYGLWRVESDAPINNQVSCKWLEAFGFKNEGVMRKYGYDGADHYRYAWVRD